MADSSEGSCYKCSLSLACTFMHDMCAAHSKTGQTKLPTWWGFNCKACLCGVMQQMAEGAEQGAVLNSLRIVQVAAEVESLHKMVHNLAAIGPMLSLCLFPHSLQDRVILRHLAHCV